MFDRTSVHARPSQMYLREVTQDDLLSYCAHLTEDEVRNVSKLRAVARMIYSHCILVPLQHPWVHRLRLRHPSLVIVQVTEVVDRDQCRHVLRSNAFSFPCSAHRYIASASAVLPGCCPGLSAQVPGYSCSSMCQVAPCPASYPAVLILVDTYIPPARICPDPSAQAPD
jgi:hypothetical protein